MLTHHLRVRPAGQGPYSLLQSAIIFLIFNDFPVHNDSRNSVFWMSSTTLPFAVCKPCFGGQEDERKDKNAKDIPLPCIPFVRPEERLFDCLENVTHDPSGLSHNCPSNSQAAAFRGSHR